MLTPEAASFQPTLRTAPNMPRSLLDGAAQFWFFVTVTGQWIFAAYVVIFYGGSALRGDFAKWGAVLPRGIIAGDTLGNVLVGLHLAMAAVILIGGPFQLIPTLRARAPGFHRINGRAYVLTACLLSVGGIYIALTRGAIGAPIQHFAIGLNGVLIIIFAALAVHYARARMIANHRRWALRLFLAVGGVWTFRVGLMLWVVANKGPVGFDMNTFSGPFLTFLSFAQFALPLAVLEVYFKVRQDGGATQFVLMAAVLIVLTLAIAAGVAAATMGMWLPRL